LKSSVSSREWNLAEETASEIKRWVPCQAEEVQYNTIQIKFITRAK